MFDNDYTHYNIPAECGQTNLCSSCSVPKQNCSCEIKVKKPCYPVFKIPEPECMEPLCIEGRIGISSNVEGLADDYIVGLGNEDRVVVSGTDKNSGTNLIPWHWLDPSIIDPEASFIPRIWTRCDGTTLEAVDRNTLIKKDPAGREVATYKNPFSDILTGLKSGFKVRLLDSSPIVDSEVSVSLNEGLQVIAGEGIDVYPVENGFKIVNTVFSQQTRVEAMPASGITVSGGTNGVNYRIGIDCGTLRANCGLVRSVNGYEADSNGNVSLPIASNNLAINTILVQTGSGLTVNTPSVGTATLGIDVNTLKASLGIGGVVKSVNNISPDSNGNVSLSAITAINSATNSGLVVNVTAGVATLGVNTSQFAANNNLQTKATNGDGLANQVLMSNGNGTYTWVNLCDLIAQLGCTGTSNRPIAPTSPASPALSQGYSQAVLNGGNSNGSTTYTCGVPMLTWSPSVSSGVTYTIKEGNVVIATGLTSNQYTFNAVNTGNRTYTVYAVNGFGESLSGLNIGPINIVNCQ